MAKLFEAEQNNKSKAELNFKPGTCSLEQCSGFLPESLTIPLEQQEHLEAVTQSGFERLILHKRP